MINSISILFITADSDAASQVIGRIRFRGHAVRAKQAGHIKDIERLLQSHRFDAIVFIEVDLKITMSELHDVLYRCGRLTPVILLTARAEDDRARDLDAGAFAAVGQGYHDLAAALTLKAVDHLQRIREMNHLKTLLQEADRRYLMMLDSSSYPIACFNRDRAIYANDAWRDCFEIGYSESLDTILLTNLVVADQQEDLNSLLSAPESQAENIEACETLRLLTRRGHEFEADLVISRAIIQGNLCTVIHLSAAGCAALEQPQAPLRERGRMPPELGATGEPQKAIGRNAESEPVGELPPGTREKPPEPDAQPAAPSPSEAPPESSEQLDPVQVSPRAGQKQLLKAMAGPSRSGADSDRAFALLVFELGAGAAEDSTTSAPSGLLLERLGRTLDQLFPAPATVALLEANQYGVFLPDAEHTELERRITEALKAASEPTAGTAIPAGKVSCGAVLADDSGPVAEELLQRARQALGQARAAGAGSHRFYVPSGESTNRPEVDLLWKQRIQDAIANDRLRLLYQPMLALRGAEIPRYNVFVRLTDPDGKVYEPAQFLPAAERMSIAGPLDQWIIRHAIATLAQQLQNDPRTVFFVKLSHGSLGPEPVGKWVREFLERSKVPARNLVVEFKEATVLTQLDSAVKTAEDLRSIGIDLCIGEFGNGLEPFQALARIQPTYVKLDGGLLTNLVQNQESRDSVARLTEQAHENGCEVIVPFVENAETLSALFSLNVNMVQGYFIQPPTEKPDFDFTQGI